MKCLCGYEKIGFVFKDVHYPEILYKRGKRKGQVERPAGTRREYVDEDPEKKDFISVAVYVPGDGYGTGGRFEGYACPECGTVKIDV